MIGKILGDRYELLEQVGEGGMSFVYKARCKKLNRYVAVKILKDSFKNNEEIVSKFKREATSIANLSNANIVNILDVGTQDDIHYIVMEYVKGKTLKEIIIDKGRLPYDVALSIALKVAKALECAHRNNIIHRDVKPQNILVTEDGVVKVADFGIAKSMDSSTIAHTSSIIGSAHYFSPEQAKGGYVDYRTDLYSLGIVLYEMITGKVPFDGDSPVTVAVKHIQENPVAPKSINSSIPDSLNILVLKAMSKEPIKRYQTARELIADIEKIKNNPNVAITNKPVEEDQFTRVMSPVDIVTEEKAKHITENLNDDYEEDDDYEDDDEDYEEVDIKPKKTRKRKSRVNWGLIFGAIIVVLIGIFAGIFVMKGLTTGNNKKVVVPDIISLSKDEAKATIEANGLVYVEVIEESKEEPGIVLKTDPGVGTEVREESIVKVTISGGESKVGVPSLVNMNLDQARDLIRSLGLSVGNITYEYNDDVPEGSVISHNPSVGEEVAKDAKIDIIVSKGAETRVQKIPDLVGKTVDDAKTLLGNLKFKINEIKGEKAPSEELSGKIYKQDPGADYEVKEGTVVTVYYYDTYEAPKKSYNTSEIIGKTKNEAKAWASQRDIDIKFNQDGAADWTVESVNVGQVLEGESITVVLKQPVIEPPTPEPPAPESPTEPEQPSTSNPDEEPSDPVNNNSVNNDSVNTDNVEE